MWLAGGTTRVLGFESRVPSCSAKQRSRLREARYRGRRKVAAQHESPESRVYGRSTETRQTTSPPSSLTRSDPSFATVTPTGRPQTPSAEATKPVRKSSYSPVGAPSLIGSRAPL